ncbi:hypothetical protein BN946_scf184664.g7 [Trametes cinnabarina]|uniref:Uncharacterized protein n=1 Tax=Pycnoporus cinnabarinus TaxID=5643 RepID=A0A060S8G3_PYCCI|nr:hypothetical protein BN946_scf184998.g66 [Trametes cinnabarina]CDO78010.1 hypothetical protein BN946_scf184664.g7 [Trametes cinnabarina]
MDAHGHPNVPPLPQYAIAEMEQAHAEPPRHAEGHPLPPAAAPQHIQALGHAAPVGPPYAFAPAYPPPGYAPGPVYPPAYMLPYAGIAGYAHPPPAVLPPGLLPHLQQLANPAPAVDAAQPNVVPAVAFRPNAEPQPGVFEVLATVLCTETVKREFTIRTDCTWDWIYSAVKQRLAEEDGDSSSDQGNAAPSVKLGYKITSTDTRRAPYAALSTEDDWKTAMSKVSSIAAKARTRTVGIEIVDLVRQDKQAKKKGKTKKKKKQNSRKRARGMDSDEEEDENVPENATQAFRELKEHLACELHSRPCYISGVASSGGHAYVSNKNLMLWAKAMARGEATKHHPPHHLEFERIPKTPRGQQGPYRQLPEIHVHIRQPKTHHTKRRISTEVAQGSSNANAPRTRSPQHDPRDSSTSPSGTPSSVPRILPNEASACKAYSWIDYPDLDQLLSALDAEDPAGGFLALRERLSRASFTNVEDVTCISPAMLHILTHPKISPGQILALYSQAELMIAETNTEHADEIAQWEQCLTDTQLTSLETKDDTSDNGCAPDREELSGGGQDEREMEWETTETEYDELAGDNSDEH